MIYMQITLILRYSQISHFKGVVSSFLWHYFVHRYTTENAWLSVYINNVRVSLEYECKF